MRRITSLLFTSTVLLVAQEGPLAQLPYTPSLDPAFMDRSADPCVDFYRYSCGSWSKLNPIPPDQAGWNVYAKMEDDNQRFLWGILQQAAQGSGARTTNEQKIGDYFHACVDEGAVERAGLKPLEPALAQIANLNSIEAMGVYIGEQHRLGLDRNLLFRLNADQDFDNSSQMIAFVAAGGLGLPDRDYYTKTDPKSQEIRRRYVQHIEHMFALIGESASDARADAQNVMDIETALAAASLTRTERRNPYNLKHKENRDALLHMAPAFDWDGFFKALGTPPFEVVNVTEPKFFDELNAQLRSRNVAAWRAYLRWHLVHSQAEFLTRPFVEENFAFFGQYLAGAKEMPARWKKCTRLIDRQLGDALGQVFVARTFSPRTKADAQIVIQQIEAEMEHDIKDLGWMSEATKAQALEKLHLLVNKVGYPDKWKDYSSVQIVPDDFFADGARAAEFEEHRELAKIGKPVDRSEWFMTPPTVNAYYNPQMNDINFPAGVLQPPLFDPKMDSAPNYGNTGATMGHELTHGFDDEGRQYDAHGNLRDWWTPKDAKAFEDRVGCVRHQYAQYVIVDDIHINSSLTLGEDVADLGGTFLAYVAWKNSSKAQDAKKIDDLTPDQRFFVGMAQWACGEERPELKRMSAIMNPHSPLEYRINGVVSNLTEFGEAFSCKVGQPMMPVHTCKVW